MSSIIRAPKKLAVTTLALSGNTTVPALSGSYISLTSVYKDTVGGAYNDGGVWKIKVPSGYSYARVTIGASGSKPSATSERANINIRLNGNDLIPGQPLRVPYVADGGLYVFDGSHVHPWMAVAAGDLISMFIDNNVGQIATIYSLKTFLSVEFTN